MEPPQGFAPVARRSPFLDLVGPLYADDADPRSPVYGLRIEQRHANSRGGVHGGVLMTVADLVLGYGTVAASGAAVPMVTASLTIDFTGSARVGDWLEGRATLERMGGRLAYATCRLTVGERAVAHASGVFGLPEAASGSSGRMGG